MTQAKEIQGHSQYMVLSNGNIFDLERSCLVHLETTNQRPDDGGRLSQYRRISLNGVRYYVHILVATAFIPKPIGDETEVEHANNNSLDNRVENLRWAYHHQNLANHPGWLNRRVKLPKNIYTTSVDGLYQIQMMKKGVKYYGGVSRSIEELVEKATQMRNDLHGVFARH